MEDQTKTARLSAFDRITALFLSPAELMRSIRSRSAAVVPLIVCMVVIVLYLPLTQRYTNMAFEMSLPQLRETYAQMGLSSDQTEMAITQARAMQGSGLNAITVVTSLISIPISALFSALGMMLVGKIFKGEATFGQYFSMYSYLLIISTLLSTAGVAINLSVQNQVNMLSLAALIPADGILSTVLSSLSVANLWTAVLAVVGLKVINEWNTMKAVLVGALSFVLSILAGLALQYLPSMLMGG